MPPLVNVNAAIMCAHGGKVMLIPKQTIVTAGGAPVTLATLGLPPTHRRQHHGGRRSCYQVVFHFMRFFLALLFN